MTKTREQLQADADRRLALLVEVRTALITAGWRDDDLLRRLRAEIAPVSPHDLPLGQAKDT